MKSLKKLDAEHCEQVEKRMKALLDKLLKNNGKMEVAKYDRTKKDNRFVKLLTERGNDEELFMLNYEENNITFKKNGHRIFCSELYFFYFKVKVIIGDGVDDRESNYIYFEQVEKEKIYGYLVDKREYKKALSPYIDGWNDAKRQMELWNQFFKIEKYKKRIPFSQVFELVADLEMYREVRLQEKKNQIHAFSNLEKLGKQKETKKQNRIDMLKVTLFSDF
jgi:hypothetical protein